MEPAPPATATPAPAQACRPEELADISKALTPDELLEVERIRALRDLPSVGPLH